MKTKYQFILLVCGRFHYYRYWEYLVSGDWVVAYSYRIGRNFRPPVARAVNLCLKEYILGLHLKVLGRRFMRAITKLCHGVWKLQLRLQFRYVGDAALVLLHGNCLGAIQRMKKKGVLVVGEAVNQHPTVLLARLNHESAHLGLAPIDAGPQYRESLQEIHCIDFLLAPSKSVVESYVEQGFDPLKIHLIPYPISIPERQSGTPRKPRSFDQGLKIVCVGQLCVRKGQIRLLNAIAHSPVLMSGVELTFVGTADPAYLDVMRETEISFSHIPGLPNAEVLALMRSSDLVVLPSIEDGFGVSAAEGISCGCRVIVSRYAGIADVVTNHPEWGVVVDPLDAGGFAAAIEAEFGQLAYSMPNDVCMGDWRQYGASVEGVLRKLVETSVCRR